jgi:hypothetical protein
MEETPDSGSAEEIQRSYTDIGAFTWGFDASTDSVSQEITPSGSQEDFACLSEAEQDMQFSTGIFSSADWSTVAEQGEHVLGPDPAFGNEQLFPKPMSGTEVAIDACMELYQPYESLDSEMAAMETDGLLKEGHEDTKQSDEEKQKTEDSVWAGVETCQKVDTRAVDIKALESTEEFEDKVSENIRDRALDLQTIAEQEQETCKINEMETREHLRKRYKESIETYENYFEEADLRKRHGNTRYSR